MQMKFTDGDDRDYQRYFDKANIEITKLVDPSPDVEANDWLTIRITSKDYALDLKFSPDEARSFLHSLVFTDVTKMS